MNLLKFNLKLIVINFLILNLNNGFYCDNSSNSSLESDEDFGNYLIVFCFAIKLKICLN
jgi:hypothetical protein